MTAPPRELQTNVVDVLRDIITVLAQADPEDKAELYEELGVNLTYWV